MKRNQKTAAEDTQEDKAPGMDLSLPMTIAELIAIRGHIIQSWKDANAAIDGIEAAFARIHDNDFNFISESHGQRFEKRQDKIDIPENTAALDYSLFVFALGKLNITNAMTGAAKDKFLADIKAKKTVFDERQLTGLAQNSHKIFRDSSINTVREVYRQLIGVGYNGGNWGSGKKDNLQKVEKVFRIGNSDLKLDHTWTGEARLSFNHWGSASSGFHFNDLLTACRLIDGEGLTDYSNNFDSKVRALPVGKASIDVGYFVAQAYQNGNVKVNWNEDKIHVLEKLNAIGSGKENDLPDVRRKRYKADHFHNGGIPDARACFAPDPSVAPSDDKDFAFYPTPEAVAWRMVDLAEYAPGMSTLEPSAGDGQIMKVVPFDPACVAIEFNFHRAEKITAAFPHWTCTRADFLKWEADQDFDRVLMNPPFNDRAEAYHLIKAFGHLRPGGILVAILPDGWFTREDIKSVILRAFLQEFEYKPSEKLSPGTFSRTGVVTRIVTLKKPLE